MKYLNQIMSVQADLDRDLDRVWAIRGRWEQEYGAMVMMVMMLGRRLMAQYALASARRELPRGFRRRYYTMTGRLIRMITATQGLLLTTNMHKRW